MARYELGPHHSIALTTGSAVASVALTAGLWAIEPDGCNCYVNSLASADTGATYLVTASSTWIGDGEGVYLKVDETLGGSVAINAWIAAKSESGTGTLHISKHSDRV